MKRVYTIKLSNGTIFQACGEEELNLKPNDECVVRRDFYMDMGRIIQVGETVGEGENIDLAQVVRIADDQDRANAELNQEKNIQAFRTAKQMVLRLNLPMKLLNAHYSMDGKMLLIQFTADGRVDFRELVKELSRAMSTRIELRQIGVRDESAISGGISVCGQVLCCARFLREFNSINVKMAKDQDLSLTPSTISGVCGRLKCCLKFEHEGYLELEKTMPRRGEWCECDRGKGKVIDRNLLTQEVTLSTEGGGTIRCKVADLRSVPPENRSQKPQQGKNRKDQEKPAQEKKDQDHQDRKFRNNKQKNNNKKNDHRQNPSKQEKNPPQNAE
ncbi:MAG: stage 0 sporulation protein [Lentisphaeria bacterium]|nr:stage 0 sporulation protein [Lentisphaeria bacterium]MBQ7394403.1 stage 0 sporulation protein [Lentisphaeria bacterium]